MIIAIIVMVAIALALLWFGTKLQRQGNQDRDQQNINITRQEFIDLKAQLEDGELTQEEYQQAYEELVVSLGTNLHHDAPQSPPRFVVGQGVTFIAIFVLLSVLTPVLYYHIGTPVAVHPNRLKKLETEAATHRAASLAEQPTIINMVENLRKRLEKNPHNPEGWTMLGRSYMVMGKYNLAAYALRQAYAQNSENPNVMLMYADALAMQNGGTVTDQAFKLIKQVLVKYPDNPTAMWMAAMAYETQKDYKHAVYYWKKLLPLVKNDVNYYQEARMHLSHAQAMLTGKPMVIPGPAMNQQDKTNPVASGHASITAVIKLDSKYKDKVTPSETVFVYARAVNGPPQPLAAKKLQVKDLPATITLDDSMAMSPTNKLSDYKQVYIGARVSQSGSVMPSSGDLQGRSGAVPTQDGKTIEVTINHEIM